MYREPFRPMPPERRGPAGRGRQVDETAVDIPPVRAEPPAVRNVPAVQARVIKPGAPGSPYPGRPTWVQGERVWCWYGPLTQRWFAFIPSESRMGLPDRLVLAFTPDMLRGEVSRVLQGAAI